MILLYTALLIVLGSLRFLIRRRVVSLETRYMRAALASEALARQTQGRDSNSSRHDALQNAKRQFLLGGLVQKSDRLEAKYSVWQNWYKGFDRFVTALQNWKGKKLPYTFGVIDVSCVLCALDYLYVGQFVSVRALAQLVTSLVSQ